MPARSECPLGHHEKAGIGVYIRVVAAGHRGFVRYEDSVRQGIGHGALLCGRSTTWQA